MPHDGARPVAKVQAPFEARAARRPRECHCASDRSASPVAAPNSSRAAALKTATARVRVTVAKPSGGPGSVLCILDFPPASGTLLFVCANPAAAGNVGSLIELHELTAGRSIIRNESGAARK